MRKLKPLALFAWATDQAKTYRQPDYCDCGVPFEWHAWQWFRGCRFLPLLFMPDG